MTPLLQGKLQLTRRQFVGRSATGIGIAALTSLLGENSSAAGGGVRSATGALPGLPHFAPKAKRVIVLWQGGGPSQVDLFDHKPGLNARRLEELPDSIRAGARLSTMTASQAKYPILPAIKPFRQYGQSGRWLSELLPHTGSIADEICLINSMQTDAVNHAPGVTFCMTGSQHSRTAEHGRVADLRAWLDVGRPAGFRGHDHRRHGENLWPAFLRILLGQRLHSRRNSRACGCAAKANRCSISTIRRA